MKYVILGIKSKDKTNVCIQQLQKREMQLWNKVYLV